MQPIYFPHTYITDETFQALTACFQKITVYQPTLRHIPESMMPWRNSDQLEIRCPIGEFETDIESSLKAYQHLGDIHQGRTREVKHFHPAGIPFFDDTSPQKIRADLIREIRGNELGKDAIAPSTAKLIHAGLFLQMAQNLDANQDGIRRNMAACAGMEKNLFKNLKEDDDLLFEELASSTPPSSDSPGEHRVRERFSAWTRLFLFDISMNHKEKKTPSLPLLFITSSQSLFDEIIADDTDNTSFFYFYPNRLEQAELASTLTRMAKANNPASFRKTIGSFINETPPVIKTAVVFNEPPLAFLAKRAGLLPGDIPDFPDRELQPNTLIGLLSTEAKGP
ncbi:MAG: hypothetical protein V2B19_01115 [Pseudomonadota bacterium]